MINFTDKENLHKLLIIEKSSLMSTLDIQKSLNKQVLIFFKNFVSNIEISNELDVHDTSVRYITQSTLILNRSNSNIKAINSLIQQLERISNPEHNISELELHNLITSYNISFNRNINYIYTNTQSIEDFIHEISVLDTDKLLAELNAHTTSVIENKQQAIIDENNAFIENEILESTLVENTLVISDYKQKVFLPYKIEDLKNILLNNLDKYTSLKDVIDKVYTKPYDYYKFSPISRFRETFNLIYKKEKKSRLKALSLATELFFNYNLHPAIISSCSTSDELDIYLACLEDNTLEDFHAFDIKFEIPPTVVTINIT